SFGVVAITPAPWRRTSTLAEVAPLHVRRDVFIPPILRPLPVSVIGPGVGVAVGVGVGVPPPAGSWSVKASCWDWPAMGTRPSYHMAKTVPPGLTEMLGCH